MKESANYCVCVCLCLKDEEDDGDYVEEEEDEEDGGTCVFLFIDGKWRRRSVMMPVMNHRWELFN